MNYLTEILAFYDWIMFNPLSSDAQALWSALMHVNNKCGVKVNGVWHWRVEFTVSNTTLLSILRFSKPQLDRKRNELVQTGRIVYRKGKGNQAGVYHIIPFASHYVTQTVIQPETQTEIQVVAQTGHNQRPLINISNKDKIVDVGVLRAHARATDAAVENYLDYSGMSGTDPDVPPEVRSYADALTGSIFQRLTARAPTPVDCAQVLARVIEYRNPQGTWEAVVSQDKADLLMYAFQAAAEAGAPGSWSYIDGVLQNLADRKINTLTDANRYDALRESL